jgi:tetratricopeptide (TPR) repeat protein
MKRSTLLPIVSLVLLLGSARTAYAQETSRAQALFDDGRRLMNEGHFAEACPKLAASQKLDPGAGTLMNLATCYEKNNQLASAWATFKDAAAASRGSSHPEWEAAARGRADQLEPELARLAVIIAKEAQVQGLVVERDGRAIDAAEWATPIPIDSGTHTIRALAPGKKTWSTQVTISAPRTRASVNVPVLEDEPGGGAVIPPPPGKEQTDVRPNDAGNTQRLVGLIVGGAGVVALGAGAFFGLKAGSTYDDAIAQCNAAHQCQQSGLDLADTATSQATISTVSFVAGGVLLAGGAVLYFTAPRGAPTTGTRGTTHVSFGGPGLAGMTFGGAF